VKGEGLDNDAIAELLAREAETATHFVQKAWRRAARMAFICLEEAATLIAQKRPLTEFPAVGPHLERIIRGWASELGPMLKS
jgi:hypothetical protein